MRPAYEFAPLRTANVAADFVRPIELPARLAATVPPRTSYVALLVNVPVPVTVPLPTWKAPIDWESEPMFNTPSVMV